MKIGEPCQRCLGMAWEGELWPEMVMPVPAETPPLSRDGFNRACCHDCASADGLVAVTKDMLDFTMARVAVGNERLEQLRMPEDMRPHMGLAKDRLVRLSVGNDALEKHHAWLDEKVPWWRDAQGGEVPDV